jgi:hypothetical protein
MTQPASRRESFIGASSAPRRVWRKKSGGIGLRLATTLEGREMGFMRKALMVGTLGGARAVGIRANSKKDRTAKALEKQTRMMRGGRRAAVPTAPKHAVACPSCSETVYLPFGDNQRCPACGKPIRVFPISRKPAIPAPRDPVNDLERLAKLHESGGLTDDEFAAAKAKILAGGTGRHL